MIGLVPFDFFAYLINHLELYSVTSVIVNLIVIKIDDLKYFFSFDIIQSVLTVNTINVVFHVRNNRTLTNRRELNGVSNSVPVLEHRITLTRIVTFNDLRFSSKI